MVAVSEQSLCTAALAVLFLRDLTLSEETRNISEDTLAATSPVSLSKAGWGTEEETCTIPKISLLKPTSSYMSESWGQHLTYGEFSLPTIPLPVPTPQTLS